METCECGKLFKILLDGEEYQLTSAAHDTFLIYRYNFCTDCGTRLRENTEYQEKNTNAVTCTCGKNIRAKGNKEYIWYDNTPIACAEDRSTKRIYSQYCYNCGFKLSRTIEDE